MPPLIIPASRLRDGLQVVRESIEDFGHAYRGWLTEAPSYSSGPSLRLCSSEDSFSNSSSSDPVDGSAFQPDPETLARVYCPISGPRWNEHRNRIVASTSIKGLTVFRNQVDAELATLERIANENGSWDEPHPYSNGTHHISFWEEVLYVAFVYGPVLSIHDRFSFSMSAALKRKRKMRKSKTQNINSQSIKVDIVSQAGDRWTRLYINKPERLRQEFREAESYMVDDEQSSQGSEQEDLDDEELAAKMSSSGGLQDSFHDHLHSNGCPVETDLVAEQQDRSLRVKEQSHPIAFDIAAQKCSLMKTIRELRAAADTEAKARTQRSEVVGRRIPYTPIHVEIVVTRMELQAPSQPLPSIADGVEVAQAEFHQLSEWDRFNHRLAAIVEEARKYDVDVVFGFRRLPTRFFGRFEYPSVSLLRQSSDPVGLPRIPTAPKRPEWRTTNKINLDVTAMIALVSDTTHGHFAESSSSDASLEHTKRHPKVEGGEQGSGSSYQHHFRTFSIRKEALEARAAELSLHEDHRDEATRALDNAAAKEGRALAIQLEREMTIETLFDAILEPICGRSNDGAPLSCRLDVPVELFATVGAFDRLRRVSSTVGGPSEKRRVKALLGDDGVGPEEFWSGSKWSSPEYDQLRRCFKLPIQPLQDLGPGGFDSLQQLRQIYPDLARAHFISHMVDTLESCLSELWGADWRDISEDLPRSKYKKLKQSSIHQAGGQTYTTLRSMHACARYGMTTLTSNMDSIQWLLKEMSRRPCSVETKTLLLEASAEDIRKLESPTQPFQSCFIVLHPRSLSEQMRVTTKAPSWREVLAGYPGGLGPPLPTEPAGENGPCNGAKEDGSAKKKVNGVDDVQGYSIDEEWQSTAISDQRGSNPILHSVDPFALRARPNYQSHDSILASPSQHSETMAGSHEAYKDPKHIAMTPLALQPEVGSSYLDTPGSLPSSSSPAFDSVVGRRSRKASFWRRMRKWAVGPRPPARLSIKHYRWWPLAKLECSWIRVTDPIAWKSPQAYAGLRPSSDRDLHNSLSRRSQRDVRGVREPNSDSLMDEYVGEDHETPGSRWWRGVLLDVKLNKVHWVLLSLVYIGWVIGFAYLAKSLWYESEVVGSNGVAQSPAFLSCTSTYWLRNAGCGIDGQDCSPFFTSANESSQPFRCPAQCNDVTLLNPRSIGPQQVNYVPLVVGGGDTERTYRGDSFICAAAIHAGIFQNARGGCGAVRLVGADADYQKSTANGLTSVGFDSVFPSSFRFDQLEGTSDCTDRRWQGYVVNAIMTAFVGFVLRPKPIVWFWTLACVGFWHINLVSEPRSYPPPIGSAIGDFLPFLFCCYVIYRLSFRFVWPAFAGLPLESTFWTLGFWWIGVLLGVVFNKVPIQRLVARDIAQQPGSLTALIIIIVVVLFIAINQIRVIRKTGYLPKYLSLYVVGGILVGLAAAVPAETLRIHHYIIALVLLPACAFPTRLSLIYIAFLLGMFTNGVARWSFDGLLQDDAVVQGDATGGTALPSFNTTSSTWSRSDGVVRWNAVPQADQGVYDGFNLLVDDVLRYQGQGTSFNLSTLPEIFAQQASIDGQTAATGLPTNQTILDSPHYLRLAYTSNGSPNDFTRAATAFLSNGTWIAPPSGAT